MSKTLTYSGFAISALLVVFAFITAKTYTQLAIAVIVYPLLAYFAMKILPHGGSGEAPSITIQVPRPMPKVQEVDQDRVIADIDKRTFLKLIGAAGLSFFVFSLLGRRVESLLFNRGLDSGMGANQIIPNDQAAGASPLEGYKITEIDDGIVSYYGFTNRVGAWLIMREDTQTNSFRYAKGDGRFASNWAGRQDLKYDYFFNLF